MFPNPHDQSPPHFTTTTSNSEETDTKKEPKTTINNNINDGGSIDQAVRRPRGRPPGTKNKPKSSVNNSVTTNGPDVPFMSPYVLEVSGGSDIVAALTQFCNNRNTSLCVLSGSGTVSSVSFRIPASPTALNFQGCFNLLSISATITPSSSPIFTNSDFAGNKFVVSIASTNGKTFGGAVVGPLIASGAVYIVAACFNNPIYHRLLPPTNEDHHEEDHMQIIRNNNNNNNSGGFAAAGGYVPTPIDDQSQQQLGGSSSSAHEGHHHAVSSAALQESLSRPPVYGNSHLPAADFIWPLQQYPSPH